LAKRCREFDNGDLGEAVDIATRLRVIFNPGGKSALSILQSLDAQKLPLLSSCEPIEDTPNIIEANGQLYSQTFAKDDDGLRYELRPKFGGSSYIVTMPASRWWEQIVEIVTDETGRHVYRRKDVVNGIANKDGGAHVAEVLPAAYDVLSKPGGIITLTIGTEDDGREVPIEGVHLAMLRQIAYEVLNSRALLALSDPKER